MRKYSLFCILFILLVSGCAGTQNDGRESMKNYETFIDSVVTNQGVESKIIPFDYKLNVYKQKDNSYQYEIEVTNPRVAMYNIQAIAVDTTIDSNTNLYPCLGLLGEDAKKTFHMIPYQANAEKDFILGFSLDGVTNKNQFTVQVMVTWKDSALLKNNRVFFNVQYAEEANDTENGKKKTADTME